MLLTDFIGAKVEIEGKRVTILYVGIEDRHVMFGYKHRGKIKTINSNKVIVQVQYINRPKLHGETYFIGPNIITARWFDEENIIVKGGKSKVLDAPLNDVKIKKG